MTKHLFTAFALFVTAAPAFAADITIRTENYPRPPYSGATYYIYEQDGQPICTKLKVCNKFDDCEVSYHKGLFKDAEFDSGAPFEKDDPIVIAHENLHKHLCLTKFHLLNKPAKDPCLVDMGDPKFSPGVKASCCEAAGGKINDNLNGHPPVTMCDGGKYNGYYVGE